MVKKAGDTLRLKKTGDTLRLKKLVILLSKNEVKMFTPKS
jgi:hypothetical protein